MNKAINTIWGPILTSFFFEITINPNKPSIIIAADARYVDEKVFKFGDIWKKRLIHVCCLDKLSFLSNK